MAGMLGGSLDRSLSRLVATMGINYHQSSSISSITILMSQSSIINHQSSILNHQSSTIHHQSSIINRPASTIHHPSSSIHHQYYIVHHQNLFTEWRFQETIWLHLASEQETKIFEFYPLRLGLGHKSPLPGTLTRCSLLILVIFPPETDAPARYAEPITLFFFG